MASPKPGYDKDLFVLPFDHRGSFESGLLGIKGRPPTSEELDRLRAFKQVIYEGFVMALAGGVPADTSAILVDQKYGADILANAGGVVVSYFEWVQDAQRYFWDLDEVNQKMGAIMVRSFNEVMTLSEKEKVSMREAAMLLAVQRVGQAIRDRGVYP